MRKLFLLIPALVLALVTKADVISINNSSANALQAALNSAPTGSIIEMAGGIYAESGNYLAFTGKELTVRAAEGQEVIIQTVCPVRLKEGAKAEFINVKFDCSTIGNYDYVIVPADDTDNKRVVLTGCEFYGWNKNKAMIEATSARRLASITIDNCYFHNCLKSVVFVENTGSIDLSITNSTFANITTDASEFSAGVIDSRATSGSILVDHCTFYNVEAMSTGYAAIGKVSLASGAVVSNCIFALSAPGAATNRTIRDHVAANNCLVYNYTTDSNYGMQSDVTKTNCAIGDPLFANAASGDFSFPANWVTMNISPACGAATDGSDLGDPRWHTAATLPTTDFASPYLLTGDKAKLSGNIWYDDVNDYLYGDGAHNQNYGTATWKLHAERACVVGVALNLNAGNTSSHTLRIEILDADGNSVGEFAEATSTLPGVLSIPAEGDYTIILHEDHIWASTKIDNITLSYIGGAVQAMPGTTDIADAWFSSNGTRADGKITFPGSTIQDGWVKWNVSFASAANFNVTLNVNSDNCKNYTVALVDANDANVVTPLTLNDCDTKGTPVALSMGAMEVPAGNYILKVTNATQHSDAELISVNFAYAGGAAVDLSKTTPASLLANADAIISDDWSIDAGKIVHAESKALTGWAKWNVDCADAANYNVTVNISSDNGHLMKVEVFEDENNSAIHTLNETSATQYHTGDLAINMGNIALEDKEYVFKVSNTGEYSHVQIASIVITYVGGAVVNIPNANIPLVDAIRSTRAFIDAEGLHFTDAENLGTISGEWAKWNIHVASEGLYKFTAHCSSTNYSNLTIAVYDGETELYTYTPQYTYNQADKEISSPEWLLGAGNYVLKLSNPANHSNGYLLSLSASVADNIIILDEMATDNSVIHANNGVNTKKILLKRTFKGGMYNTICLPFSDWNSSLELVFGAGYELLELESTELVGDELDLNFSAVTELGHGRPYLIKPEQDVVNPIFGTGHTINESTGYNVKSCTNADFIGSFIKGEVPAGEDNLFLGPNNLLYFSDSATPIKGMRAWFQVKGVPNPSLVIKRANIVTKKDGTTDIELVNGQEETKSQKLLRDGQLIIIRDGVQYNVMGVKLQ